MWGSSHTELYLIKKNTSFPQDYMPDGEHLLRSLPVIHTRISFPAFSAASRTSRTAALDSPTVTPASITVSHASTARRAMATTSADMGTNGSSAITSDARSLAS